MLIASPLVCKQIFTFSHSQSCLQHNPNIYTNIYFSDRSDRLHFGIPAQLYIMIFDNLRYTSLRFARLMFCIVPYSVVSFTYLMHEWQRTVVMTWQNKCERVSVTFACLFVSIRVNPFQRQYTRHVTVQTFCFTFVRLKR